VQEIVAEEGIFDSESDTERCELINFGERVPHLMDKKREVFRTLLNVFR
jgi:hypothetical protein